MTIIKKGAELWPSLALISQHWGGWLRKQGLHAWMPSYDPYPDNLAPEAILDVVLVGRLHEEMLLASAWPRRSYRLWSLSVAAQQARIKVAEIPATHMGVIPRDECLPPHAQMRPYPSASEAWSLVFSGRPTLDKGFALYLRTASTLQLLGEDVTPVIYGVLEMNPTEESRASAKKLTELLAALPWRKRPEFHAGLGPLEWLDQGLRRPVLFNFSVFENEDLGVSISQSRARGWPVLISNWGGHRDVAGKMVRRFDVTREMVQDCASLPALDLAEDIRRRMRRSEPELVSKAPDFPLPLRFDELLRYSELLKSKGVAPKQPWPRDITIANYAAFLGQPND